MGAIPYVIVGACAAVALYNMGVMLRWPPLPERRSDAWLGVLGLTAFGILLSAFLIDRAVTGLGDVRTDMVRYSLFLIVVISRIVDIVARESSRPHRGGARGSVDDTTVHEEPES